MSVTFVSAYYTLEDTPHFQQHPHEWDPHALLSILETGVHLCLYLSPTCPHESMFRSWAETYTHFRIMPERVHYRDLFAYRCFAQAEPACQLPANRNLAKDTLEYMVYMHARTELMGRVVNENPWSTSHFAWVDYQLPNMFSRKTESLALLREIATHVFPENVLYVAGCWGKLDMEVRSSVVGQIHWRFCGPFFLGDGESLRTWDRMCREKLPGFLREYGTFPWEVNYWAWIEATTRNGELLRDDMAPMPSRAWSITWYRGDHNDSILDLLSSISADSYTSPLPLLETREYDYPSVPTFYPSSAAYLSFRDAGGVQRHILNTRFVNYWMYPNGYYRFANPDNVIENRNYVSLLDDQLEPTEFREMSPTLMDTCGNRLQPAQRDGKRAFSEGLEDIRLFGSSQGTNPVVRFIATNVDYSPTGRNRMIVGTYHWETATYTDCQVVIPPGGDSWCEKNWIPLYREDLGEEWFLYKWSPIEWGRIDPATGQLAIVERHYIDSWIFRKLRGSTAFVDYDEDHWVTVAHFSEEHGPRHYYHVLVLFAKATRKPVAYSRTFCFEKLSIEFCLGFRMEGEDYVFWVSRFDRDPVRVKVARREMKWAWNVNPA